MIVAGSVQLTGRPARLEEVPGLKLNRNYECANAKLSRTLGFIPRRSVLEAVTDMLSRFDPEDRVVLTDPRAYNIRWLELLHALKPDGRVLRFRPMRALITGGGGQLASDLATLLGEDARAFDRTELDITHGESLDRVFAGRTARCRLQLRGVSQRGCL